MNIDLNKKVRQCHLIAILWLRLKFIVKDPELLAKLDFKKLHVFMNSVEQELAELYGEDCTLANRYKRRKHVCLECGTIHHCISHNIVLLGACPACGESYETDLQATRLFKFVGDEDD